MKKALRLLAAFLGIAVCVGTASADAVEFKDVSSTDYFYDAVNWGAEAGITSGVAEGVFDPDGEVNRAQIVTFLWNMAGNPTAEAGQRFSDVESGSWYENAVAWATENNITMGTGDNMFSPDVVCSRAMCVTLLYRFMGSTFDAADAVEITDDEISMEDMTMEDFANYFAKSMIDSLRESGTIIDVKAGDYYELAVFWALMNGIVDENTESVSETGIMFRPNDACTRKEMIYFLYNAKRIEEAANAPAEIYFGDNLILPIPQEYYGTDTLAIEVYGLYDYEDDDEEGDEEVDEDETAIIVSELASKEAAEALGEDTEGQGELFRIIRVSEDRLRELLSGEMSGFDVFAKDEKDRYYIICYPTDVRFVRETVEKMREDADIWTELNEWARDDMGGKIIEYSTGLEPVALTDTMPEE